MNEQCLVAASHALLSILSNIAIVFVMTSLVKHGPGQPLPVLRITAPFSPPLEVYSSRIDREHDSKGQRESSYWTISFHATGSTYEFECSQLENYAGPISDMLLIPNEWNWVSWVAPTNPCSFAAVAQRLLQSVERTELLSKILSCDISSSSFVTYPPFIPSVLYPSSAGDEVPTFWDQLFRWTSIPKVHYEPAMGKSALSSKHYYHWRPEIATAPFHYTKRSED